MGRITNYDPNDPELAAGGSANAVFLLYTALSMMVIPVALLMWNRCESGMRIPLLGATILACILVLFAAGGRSQFLVSLALAAVFLRRLGARLRLTTAGAAVAALLAISLAITSYRGALQQDLSNDSGTSRQIEAATRAIAAAADNTSRQAVMEDADANVTVRLAYAPFYFVAVDYVLQHGPSLTPHFLQGPLLWIPTILAPSKNEWAHSFDLRRDMYLTGRYPALDLDLSPILEWVFDVGIILAPLGGILYGFLARLIDRALDDPPHLSLARWIIIASFAKTLFAFESSGDYLFMSMREPLVVAVVAALVTGAVTAWRGHGSVPFPRVPLKRAPGA
jgi:hypothetical protein